MKGRAFLVVQWVVAVLMATTLLPQCSMGFENMNGEYLIANLDSASKVPFSTDFGTRNCEYFEVYSSEISTKYAEVFWCYWHLLHG